MKFLHVCAYYRNRNMEYVSHYELNEFEKYLSIRKHLRERKQSSTFIFDTYNLSNLRNICD